MNDLLRGLHITVAKVMDSLPCPLCLFSPGLSLSLSLSLSPSPSLSLSLLSPTLPPSLHLCYQRCYRRIHILCLNDLTPVLPHASMPSWALCCHLLKSHFADKPAFMQAWDFATRVQISRRLTSKGRQGLKRQSSHSHPPQ